MAEFDDKTTKALQAIYGALMKLQGGMRKLEEAAGGSVEADVKDNNNIERELDALRNLEYPQRIWPPPKK